MLTGLWFSALFLLRAGYKKEVLKKILQEEAAADRLAFCTVTCISFPRALLLCSCKRLYIKASPKLNSIKHYTTTLSKHT
jgi:hypothetical protein